MIRHTNSRAAELANRLQTAARKLRQLPLRGSRDLPVIEGVSLRCESEGPLENKLVEAQQILVQAGRFYRYGNSIVLADGDGENGRLVSLCDSGEVSRHTPSLLANYFVCSWPGSSQDQPGREHPPSAKFVETLFNRKPTRDAFNEIRQYARRPVFDREFRLLDPGYHADTGTLVHGIAIEPPLEMGGGVEGQALVRLPTHLATLLRDFCFRTDADVVNTVAAMITGLLSSHFVETGKPLFLLDGNQPGLGKTLLARVISVVLDNVDPKLVPFTPDDDELHKRIVAVLRSNEQAVLILDNAKTRAGSEISSPTLESVCVSPEISLRILGKSENFRRPNDVLWFITMNSTRVSRDLVSRHVPIRLHHTGNPGQRTFAGRDPLKYAKEHRQELLGELAGMVSRWNQAGRRPGDQPHRLAHWAAVIGGILKANNLPEGLANLDEAACEFDTSHDELAALAEAIVGDKDGPYLELKPQNGEKKCPERERDCRPDNGNSTSRKPRS